MMKWTVVTAWIAVAFSLNAAPVQRLWEARYNGPLNREDLLSAMTVDEGERVYVTGSSDNNVNPDPYATVKYDTNGTSLWVSRYTGPRMIDSPTAIAVDSEGNVYVTGLSHGTASGYDPDYATVKYAPGGAELWVARYNAHSNSVSTADNPYALVVNSAGEVYVTGASVSAQGSLDFATLKYDTNGAQLWLQRYNGPDNRGDAARGMGIDSSGDIYVGGLSERNEGAYEVAVLKYAADGTRTWVSRFAAEMYWIEPTMAMKVDASGNSYIAFAGQQTGSKWRLFALKYDRDGNLLWNSSHRVLRDYGQILLAGAHLDSSQNFCVSASVNQWGNADYLTIRFSSAGDELWSSRFNSPFGYEDHARSIAVDSADNIYVTGLSYLSGNQYQLGTVKYRPDGHREWVLIETNSSGNGISAGAVQVDSAGHVYVSGSVGVVGSKDCYTAKYRQTPQAGAPVIVASPTAQTVLGGASATFSVTATGTEPLSFVWRRDGQVISAETGSSLVLSNLTFADRGYYSVEVSNSDGSTASPEAGLNVVVRPFIVEHPRPHIAILGARAEFSVVAGGTPPFAYQWHRGGMALAGATNATLVISNVQTSDVGGYNVVVGNEAGATNSNVAELSLVPGIEQCFAVADSNVVDYYSSPQILRVDSQGRANVAQTSYGPGNTSQILTVQFDTNGAIRWSARFVLGTNIVNMVSALALDAAGNLFVAGSSGSYDGTRVLLLKYGPDGNLIWQALHHGSTNRVEFVNAIALDNTGNIYLAGSAYAVNEPSDFLTVKFDALGTQVWSEGYSASPMSSGAAVDLKADATGSIYVFGNSVDTSARLVMLKYDSNGTLIWFRAHECGSQGNAVALELHTDGNIIAAGTAADTDGNTDLATLKYDVDGNLLWLAQYSAYQDSFDYSYSLALDGAGNIYVAGASSLPNEENTGLSVFSTVKYDAAGNELWVASRIDAAGYGGPDSLAVDDDGNSYLAFSKYFSTTGTDFLVYKYDNEGSRVWTALWGKPGTSDEYPTALALDHEGSLLVAGLTPYPQSQILLLKYKNRPSPGLPIITQAPESRDILVGSTVAFSVAAMGDAPLLYQWYFNGTAIGGAIGSSYTVANASSNHAGHYSVEVRNAIGSVLSVSAILSISIPPQIVRQPDGRSVLAGTEVVFDVAATGTRPLHYHWQRNGSNILGAVGPVLRLTDVQAGDSGVYSVIVSNRAGSATSAGAVLSVSRQGRREWLVNFSAGTGHSTRLQDTEVDAAGDIYLLNQPGFLLAKYDSSGEQVWSTPPTVPGGSAGCALVLDGAGNSYATGFSFDTGGASSFLTIKFNPSGDQVWARELRPGGHPASGHDVALAPDGSVYVTGRASGPSQGVTTIKYENNGTQAWVRHFGSSSNDEVGRRVLVDTSGNVYVWANVWSSTRDAVLLKYDSSGTLLWSRTFGDAGTDEAIDMAIDFHGHIVVTAYSSHGDFVTIKYDSSGAEQWFRRFDNETYLPTSPAAMALDSTGNIYITGFVDLGYSYDDDGNFNPDHNVLTIKYNAAGDLQWSARYGAPAIREDAGVDIAVDTRGGVSIAGYITRQNNDRDMLVLRYDANGTRYWSDVFATDQFDHGLFVQTAGSNCIYAAGETYNAVAGNEQVVLLKYTHNEAAGVPAIITPPQSLMVIAGSAASFSVVATGDAPLQYRWYFNGEVIAGGTAPTLSVPNVERINAGIYRVEVSNEKGLVVSADALLTVRVPARIISGPEDQCIVASSHAVFRIGYEGDGQVDISWQHNGMALLSGDAIISVTNANTTNAGIYSVTVSNEFGSMTAAARLIVTPQAGLAWASNFNSGALSHNYPYGGTSDAQGNVYITGSGSDGIRTVKFDPNGAIAWAASYNTTNQGSATGYGITVGGDGSVYVVGAINPSAISSQDFVTLKYDAHGNLLWASRYDHGSYDFPTAIAIDPLGNVYVTGAGGTLPYGTDYVTVKYAPNGDELWVRDYIGPDGGEDRPAALAVDSAGNVYVTGYTTEANQIEYYQLGDYLTLKYDTDGNQIWSARHSGPGSADDRAVAIALDAAGNVYVTGSHSHDYYVNSGTTVYFDHDYATIKYDPNGQQLWLAVYAGHRPSPDQPADVKVDSFGNVYVTGASEQDLVTVRYNSLGEQQWVSRVDSGAFYDVATALALDAYGNTYVSGHSGDYGDILTFKLDSNGSRLWTARYTGPGGDYGSQDFPVGIGVDSGGNVLVSGSVDRSLGARDFIALKYAPGVSAGTPVIMTPPHDQSAPVGSTVAFSVTASGDAPLRYQWRRNSVALASETNSTLQLVAGSATAARYSVVVFNDLDCVISAEAVLTVVAPQMVQCTGIQIGTTGVRLVIVGPPSYYYRIEATSDLATWETIATVYNASGVFEHTDTLPALSNHRFYRVVKQP